MAALSIAMKSLPPSSRSGKTDPSLNLSSSLPPERLFPANWSIVLGTIPVISERRIVRTSFSTLETSSEAVSANQFPPDSISATKGSSPFNFPSKKSLSSRDNSSTVKVEPPFFLKIVTIRPLEIIYLINLHREVDCVCIDLLERPSIALHVRLVQQSLPGNKAPGDANVTRSSCFSLTN